MSATAITLPVSESQAVYRAFGQLIADVSAVRTAPVVRSIRAVQNVSPLRAEARRLEAEFRARYAANEAALNAVSSLSTVVSLALCGPITKDSLALALAEAQSPPAGDDDERLQHFVRGAEYLLQHWNSFSLSPYKNVSGAIDAASARAGRERMAAEQVAIARQIQSIELNVSALDRAQAEQELAQAQAEEIVVVPVTVTEVIARQAETRPGEGPHQVAARVLGSDGRVIEEAQVLALTAALKRTYEDECRANPEMRDEMGVPVGHKFITSDNINAVLGYVDDAAVKERLTRIVAQNVAYCPPVISPIPPRVPQLMR